jgi:hypothetical protein
MSRGKSALLLHSSIAQQAIQESAFRLSFYFALHSQQFVCYQTSLWSQDSCSSSRLHNHTTSKGQKQNYVSVYPLFTGSIPAPFVGQHYSVKVSIRESGCIKPIMTWPLRLEIGALNSRACMLEQNTSSDSKCVRWQEWGLREGPVCNGLPLLGFQTVQLPDNIFSSCTFGLGLSDSCSQQSAILCHGRYFNNFKGSTAGDWCRMGQSQILCCVLRGNPTLVSQGSEAGVKFNSTWTNPQDFIVRYWILTTWKVKSYI